MRFGLDDGSEHTLEEVGIVCGDRERIRRSKRKRCVSCGILRVRAKLARVS